MADSIWQDISYLNLLWLIIPLAALFLYAFKRRQKKMAQFAHACQLAQLTKFANTPARITRAILIALAVAIAIIALARPAWNKTKQPFKAKGRDVVFILDISRSMLAQHRNTTRLEEAKFAIQECLATIQGDRVALIIFAGNPKIVCPLTHDYAYFMAKLEDVDYRSVAFGGTMLGDAVRMACDGIFKNKANLYRDVIVITDGEDMQSNPIQAAERLAELNARLIAVGMGDEIPHPLVINTPDGKTEQLTDNGKTVMTRLDADTLRKMTAATQGGVFIPVHADTTLNLSDIYEQLIKSQLKQDFEEQAVVTYDEKFQVFLLLALILLALARLLPERRTPALALILTALIPLIAAAEETHETADQLVQQAYEDIRANKLVQAEKSLKKVLDTDPEHMVATFNQGILNYQRKNYQQALKDFQKANSLARAQLAHDEHDTQAMEIRERAQLATANAAYLLSQQTQQTSKTKDPMQQLENNIQNAKLAVDSFQQALNLEPDNTQTKKSLGAAKYNHKKLLYTKKQLQKQQQKQQQNQKNKDQKKDSKEQKDQQNQDKQNQDKQNQDKQNQDKQNQDKQNQDKQNQDKQNQDKQNQQQKEDLKKLEQQQRQAARDMKDSSKSKQDLQKQQQDLNQQAQEQSDKQEQKQQQDGSPQNQKAEDFLKEAAKKQQEARQQLNQDQKDKAQQAQKEAADLTRMARKALDQKPGQQPKQQPKQQQQQPKPEQQQPKQQPQAKPMDARAMDAINQEQINRKQKKMFYVAPPAHMNKDW